MYIHVNKQTNILINIHRYTDTYIHTYMHSTLFIHTLIALSVECYICVYMSVKFFISFPQPSMKCYTEEIFGPVLVSLSVDTLDDVRICL